MELLTSSPGEWIPRRILPYERAGEGKYRKCRKSSWTVDRGVCAGKSMLEETSWTSEISGDDVPVESHFLWNKKANDELIVEQVILDY